jgi:hypothetical protein
MRVWQSITYCLISVFITFSQAYAWDADGHHTVGAIADKMVAGTHAGDQVKAILGNISLRDASVWADCAKGIIPSQNYTYHPTGTYPECKIFETPEGEAGMGDFVRRNDKNCNIQPGVTSCHDEYHYTDVAIQRDHYDRSYIGTRNDDIVGAVGAAIHVLKGEPAPAPFNFKDQREALLVLSHYVGDIHQPLHVGAAYLDTLGKLVDPDKGTFDPTTETQGGNKIFTNSNKLHAMWDAIPAALKESHVATLLAKAKTVPVTAGQVYDWPANWASGTLGQAKQAFSGLTFSSLQNNHWNATLPAKYSTRMSDIKKMQLVEAGARLAQLLEAIWP